MSKISKFLICENPLVDDERVFILHTRQPMILAEVVHFEGINDSERMDIERKIETPRWARLDYPPETIYFFMIKLYPDEKFLKMNTQEQADTIAGLMRRMADWYKSYLIFEDNNIANENE